MIVMPVGDLKLPEQPIPLLPRENRLPIGVEVAWLGFPSVAQANLCFFAGNVSAWQDFRHAYLIDGVAINGGEQAISCLQPVEQPSPPIDTSYLLPLQLRHGHDTTRIDTDGCACQFVECVDEKNCVARECGKAQQICDDLHSDRRGNRAA